MDQEIINKLKAEKNYLQKQYKVTRLGIFGSFVHGKETPESDIDILIEFSEVPGMREFFSTEEYLENIFHRKIDLVREKAIRPELKAQILSEVVYV